jgi:septum formation protein
MPLWCLPQPLVLASRSAARAAVLRSAGLPIEIDPADIDERGFEAGLALQSPGESALALAREKARVTANQRPGRLVLGADQTLALETRRFDKPADRAAARAQLVALSGRRHDLHSAIVLMRDKAIVFERVAVASLTMRALSETFLEAYLDAAGAAVTTSVGGYQLEGFGAHLFERIEGDHFTILGMPLMPLLAALRRDGALAA